MCSELDYSAPFINIANNTHVQRLDRKLDQENEKKIRREKSLWP